MKMRYKDVKDEIEKLDSKSYEGYVQYIDLSGFDVFIKDKEIKLKDNRILEAHFSDGENSISYRFINGEYFKLKDQIPKNSDEKDMTTYLSYKDNLKVKIYQVWEEETYQVCEEENDNCDELKQLVPKYQLFAGFEKEGK